MKLTDIITDDRWHGDRLAVFTTITTTGAELQISEWLEDTGLDVELRDSHARAHCHAHSRYRRVEQRPAGWLVRQGVCLL